MKKIYNGKYGVTDDGRIYSFKYKKYLMSWLVGKGYESVRLQGKTRYIHDLVLTAYVGEKPEGYVCNHIDGNKTNNELTNLEYVTYSANNKHAYDIGLKRKGEKHGNAKLQDFEVLEIRRLYATGDYYQKDLGKMYGVCQTHISDLIRGTYRC